MRRFTGSSTCQPVVALRYADPLPVFRVLRKVVEQVYPQPWGMQCFQCAPSGSGCVRSNSRNSFPQGQSFPHERFKRFFVKKQHLAGGKRIDLGNSMRIRQEQARRAQQGPRGEHAHQHAPGFRRACKPPLCPKQARRAGVLHLRKGTRAFLRQSIPHSRARRRLSQMPPGVPGTAVLPSLSAGNPPDASVPSLPPSVLFKTFIVYHIARKCQYHFVSKKTDDFPILICLPPCNACFSADPLLTCIDHLCIFKG